MVSETFNILVDTSTYVLCKIIFYTYIMYMYFCIQNVYFIHLIYFLFPIKILPILHSTLFLYKIHIFLICLYGYLTKVIFVGVHTSLHIFLLFKDLPFFSTIFIFVSGYFIRNFIIFTFLSVVTYTGLCILVMVSILPIITYWYSIYFYFKIMSSRRIKFKTFVSRSNLR